MKCGRIDFSLFLVLLLSIGACTKHSGQAISIAYPSAGAIMNTHIGLILEKTDILKKHGFDASISSMGTGRELKVAMVSGKADVILTTETNFPVLLGEGFDAVAVSSLGSAGGIGLLVKNEKYKQLSDLKDKSIATIFGTSVHEPAVKWAKESGAKLVSMGSVAAMQAALESGEVDAIVSWDPYLTASLKKGSARVLMESGFDLITVATAAFAKNKEAVEKFNEVLKDAVVYLRDHRDEINSEFSRMSNIETEVIHEASMKNDNYARKTGDVIAAMTSKFTERLNVSSEFLFNEKIVRRKPEIESHIWIGP